MLEATTIEAAISQDRRAQAAIYDKYKRYWFTICLRYQSQRHDAEDALQNALVQIFSKLHLFQSEKGEFKDWSAKVVVNANLMLLRSKKDFEELDKQNEDVIDTFTTIEANHPSLEELTQVIQKLPGGYRAVFNLYVLEGYTHDEIAEILGITTGTSKSQLFKARKMLKEMISTNIQLKAV